MENLSISSPDYRMNLKGTLLFVDDNPEILQLLRLRFKSAAYRIHTALSGEEGLEIIKRHTIDVLIADYIMPGINGLELIERGKAIAPAMHTIIFTAHGDLHSAKKAISLGVKAYVEKDQYVSPDKLSGEVLVLSRAQQKDLSSLQDLVDRLLTANLRYEIVRAMNCALRLWEVTAKQNIRGVSKYVYKATFAEASGLWKVQDEKGIQRTRGLDRYLEIETLPKRPNKQMVLRSIWFVLENHHQPQSKLWVELRAKADRLERLFWR